MAEKTIEELQLELTQLKQKNLENELQKEKDKLALFDSEKNKREFELLKEKAKAEVMVELSERSNIVSGSKPETLSKPINDLQHFSETFIKAHKLKGLPYEEMIRQKCMGVYA